MHLAKQALHFDAVGGSEILFIEGDKHMGAVAVGRAQDDKICGNRHPAPAPLRAIPAFKEISWDTMRRLLIHTPPTPPCQDLT